MSIRFILFSFSFAFLLTGISPNYVFAQKRKGKKVEKNSEADKVDADGLTYQERVAAESYFTEGMKYFILQDFNEALKKFKGAYEIDKKNAATAYQIAYTYTKLVDLDKAVGYAEKAIQNDTSNPFYYELYADILKGKGNYNEAIEAYKNLLVAAPKYYHYYYQLAGLYLQTGKLEDAVQVYDNLERQIGVTETVSRQKQRILLKMDEGNQAVEEGEKLMTAFPDNPEYLFYHANLLIDLNRFEEAHQLLESFDASSGPNGNLQLVNARIYKAENNEEAYFEALKNAFADKSVAFLQKKEMIKEFLYKEEYKGKGLELSKVIVETHPEETEANMMYADFLTAQKRFAPAREYYEKALEQQAEDYQLWERLVQLDFELTDYQTAINRLERALEYFPNQAKLYVMLGTAYYFSEDYESAKSVLRQGKMLATQKETLVQVTTQLGDLYHKLGKSDLSDASYEEVLKIDPNNQHVLNNYSYYLAERRSKLEKAFQMSQKLYEADSNNETFIDTHAWVLFAKRDYNQALKLLEPLATTTSNATIVEHYGDVLYKLGRIEEALDQWQKALSMDGARTTRLEEKIAAKKIIE